MLTQSMEVLAALYEGPLTLTELAGVMDANRRTLVDTIRRLEVDRMVQVIDTKTGKQGPPARIFSLTWRGHELLMELSDDWSWREDPALDLCQHRSPEQLRCDKRAEHRGGHVHFPGQGPPIWWEMMDIVQERS